MLPRLPIYEEWPVSPLGPLITNIDSTVVNVSARTCMLGSQPCNGSSSVPARPRAHASFERMARRPLRAKRVYLGCFSALTFASLLCGISSSAHRLITAPVAREAPHHIARVMSVMTIPIILGSFFGPSLAGFILQRASWHWIFFINLPIGLLAVLPAVWILPSDITGKRRRSFDIFGFLLILPGLVLLLYSLEALSSEPGAVGRLRPPRDPPRPRNPR